MVAALFRVSFFVRAVTISDWTFPVSAWLCRAPVPFVRASPLRQFPKGQTQGYGFGMFCDWCACISPSSIGENTEMNVGLFGSVRGWVYIGYRQQRWLVIGRDTIQVSRPIISVGEGSPDKLLSSRACFPFPTQGQNTSGLFCLLLIRIPFFLRCDSSCCSVFSSLNTIIQMSLKSGFVFVEAVKFMPCDDFTL